MADSTQTISIDQLIQIVVSGGTIRTGVDIFNKQGRLVLEKDVLVEDSGLLINVKKFGVSAIPIVLANAGGVWDRAGNIINFSQKPALPTISGMGVMTEIDRQIKEVAELKQAASEKYKQAKQCIKQALHSIHETGGYFEFAPIKKTVTELFDFIIKNDNAFFHLTKEIFSYDDYLYNHSLNVCVIGTVVMKNFNDSFSTMVNKHLGKISADVGAVQNSQSFRLFLPEEMRDISIGFFMHDIGKMLIDRAIIDKKGKLTVKEFEAIKAHSVHNGVMLLEKNNLANPYICQISYMHHCRLYNEEERCYPENKAPVDIPSYVKICKLADIYDAMTSRRIYKEALNPVGVVADIFHKYAEKDSLLQFILHAFVNAVGIYPPGSVVSLVNGQLAYVFGSKGPILIPITDINGQPLQGRSDMFILDKDGADNGLNVDRRRAPLSPRAVYKILPDYLKKSLQQYSH